MDVEKTIEFILNLQAAAEARQAAADARQAAADDRLSRFEALTISNAEDIKGLAVKLGELAQLGIETDKRIDQLAKRFDEQDRKLAARIDNLVSGIGEFMRRDAPPSTH